MYIKLKLDNRIGDKGLQLLCKYLSNITNLIEIDFSSIFFYLKDNNTSYVSIMEIEEIITKKTNIKVKISQL